MVDVRPYATSDPFHKVVNVFVGQKVDVIFVGQPFVALAAKQAIMR